MVGMDDRERARHEERLRILDLLEAATERRDDVLAIVDASEDAEEAQERIGRAFRVEDPRISRSVLDMQLSRFTREQRERLADERRELRALLKD